MTNKNKNLNLIGELKAQLNTPKTETRIILNDWQAEVKTSKLSAAARNKVVNSGSYISSRANIANPSYGPGEDATNTKYCAASGCYEKIEDSLSYCSKHNSVMSSKERRKIVRDLAEAADDMPAGTEIEFKKEEKDSQGNYKSETLTVRKK